MRILNLHGYNGYMYNAAYQALTECGYDVVAFQIDYDSDSPKDILERLSSLYLENGCNAVVGTSLGGFFALLISAKFKCPVVLVNPCLMPFVYLPRLGYSRNGGVLEFSQMFSGITEADKNLISTIIGEEDEVIDSHDYTKALLQNSLFFTVPNGKHSGATLPLREIFSAHGKEFFGIFSPT